MMDTNFYEACANDSNVDKNGILECVAGRVTSTQNDVIESMNVFFIICASSLVFFMQAGFAMICAGSVRKENIQNTMLKNLLDACGSAIAYFSVGYAFSFGGNLTGKTVLGNGNFFLMNLDDDEYGSWLFQFAFAATSGTIVAGTMAERCQMKAYLLYSVFLTGFVYPVVAHSVWSKNGFLNFSVENPLWGVGMIDFAGSGVVHVTGGVTALIATVILGPRRGRFYDEAGEKLEKPKPMKGHSTTMQMLGTFILWFGWFGFNAGCAIDYDISFEMRPTVMAVSIINTTLSAATAGITALFTNLILTERETGDPVFDITYAMNGCLSGLVAVTGGCAVIEPWASIIIGFVAGLLYLYTSKLLIRWCLDDAVDAIPVHLSNGIWGILATGLFASRIGMERLLNETDPPHIGWFYSWGEGSADARLLGCEAIGILLIIAWVSCMMGPFFFALKYFGMFRSDPLEELIGLDISYHGSAGRSFLLGDGKLTDQKSTCSNQITTCSTTDNFTTNDVEVPDNQSCPNSI